MTLLNVELLINTLPAPQSVILKNKFIVYAAQTSLTLCPQ